MLVVKLGSGLEGKEGGGVRVRDGADRSGRGLLLFFLFSV